MCEFFVSADPILYVFTNRTPSPFALEVFPRVSEWKTSPEFRFFPAGDLPALSSAQIGRAAGGKLGSPIEGHLLENANPVFLQNSH